MKIEFRPLAEPLDAEVENRARRRLEFALGRFGQRIRRVVVRLEDLNGPRGGVDQRCHMEVQLNGRPPLHVEVRDTEAGPAIARAADRGARRVREALTASWRVHRRRRNSIRTTSSRESLAGDAA
jgi:putative sigma-54 modulation protein